MLHTVEMRWFFRDPPLDQAQLFADAALPQTRTDWYVLPCDAPCGIKLREGRLEAKLRVAVHGIRTFEGFSGQLESWQKWGLEFAPGEGPADDLLVQSGWLAVNKQRYLRHFEVADDRVVEIDTRPHNGCEFEMTRLRVQQQTWWTSGFEAVGPPEQLEANLQRVAHYIQQQGRPLLPFVPDCSFGYAHWLAHVLGTRPGAHPAGPVS